jgi:flavin reductase (DIM6/NTAB) family NADH-FMN oxidoreductase RutF
LSMIEPDVFRTGMRRLAASVCLITTLNEDGSRNGLTATAVCSMTAAPPTLLCCLNRSSNSFAAIEKAGMFAVNVLSTDDREIADRFATSLAGDDKFALGDWAALGTGAPILTTAIAAFDCRLANVVAVGTHGILLGEVQAIELNPHEARPLLYVDGAYGAFHPHEMLTTKAL